MTDNATRLGQLLAALTEAKINEKREAAKMLVTSAAHKAQEARWHVANASIEAAKNALNDYAGEQSESAAKAHIKLERRET